MEELTTVKKQLPDTLPELSKFVLVGREKLTAVRAEIRAINKVGLAKEVREQKLKEAQEIAELVTVAEMQIGAMLQKIPQKQGTRTDLTSSVGVEQVTTKAKAVADLGFSKDQVSQFQRMAEHEDIVEQAIANARENDDVVSRSAVLKAIKEEKQPHVTNNSHDNEWYTPEIYIEAAREVMGGVIDLDPASNDFANQTVKAKKYYSIEDDGLQHEWFGNIWMNPPYSTKEISDFARKLSESTFNQAIVLVNNATETEWFRTFIQKANAIVFPTGRIKYRKRDGEKGTPLQGQAFIYFGQNEHTFLKVFSHFGWGCKIAKL